VVYATGAAGMMDLLSDRLLTPPECAEAMLTRSRGKVKGPVTGTSPRHRYCTANVRVAVALVVPTVAVLVTL
jgi:hypothetical protein